jgi:hypothetical protein
MSNDQLPRWDKAPYHPSRYITRPNTWVAEGEVWFSPANGVWTAQVRVPGHSSLGAHLVTEAEAKAWVELTVGLIGG